MSEASRKGLHILGMRKGFTTEDTEGHRGYIVAARGDSYESF